MPSHFPARKPVGRRFFFLWPAVVPFLFVLFGCGTLVGCGPSQKELEAVTYAPVPRDDWPLSTPAAEGLDPLTVARLYFNAAKLETLYGVVVVKNGTLVAEKYFNKGSIDQLSGRMSATKSVTSAVVGIALEQGKLSGLDQKMMEFFPENLDKITDPRKKEITIRQLLQMRSGFPWEEHYPEIFDRLFMHDDWSWLPHVVDVPLVADPGTAFGYSNLSSHLLAIIAARACGTDIMPYAQKYIFDPIGAEIGAWTKDPYGYRWGHFEIYITARDMAKFGLLYFNGGSWNGKQVLPAAWVRDSLKRYSEGINFTGWLGSELGRYFRDLGYGYQWWSARVGDHRFDFAWGHGGQLIVLLRDLDMIVVTTADPLYYEPAEKGWTHEGAIIDLAGEFISTLPAS
ncbi:MAG: serine hydrolase [Spirochaetales bacterium]|nr:serine hydrolase [Spirochaetales bacterium]